MKMNEYLKSGIVLSVICIILALVLGGVNLLTAPVIEENDRLATQGALLEVYPDAKDFESVELAKFENVPVNVTEAYRADDGGYVIKITTTGYKSGLVLIFGISPDLKIVGASALASNETLSYEKTYGENFIGKDMAGVLAVDTVSGATKTTSAYKNAAKDAIDAASVFAKESYTAIGEKEVLVS